MIGVNFGSLNSSIALGKAINPSLIFKTELLLSDTSLRTCPSIISYTSSHRLIGDHASLVIKKNMKSSFQYINRLIGFNLNIPFYQTEYNKYYYIGGNYNQDQKKFCALNDEMLYPEEIVISYLHLLYNSYILENNIECDYFVFSVPDYFNCFHKEAFKRIIEVINLKKEYSIINESSAITLYFGYKKYNEYFITKNQIKDQMVSKIDPTITKYVLFIDAGHSKTTFIFSKLTYNLFIVLNSVTLPFLGGRDFDNKIFEYCAKNFMDTYNIDIKNDNKIKIRLMNPIMKARKNLTVNKEVQINIDSLKDDNDLSVLLKREDFEKLIEQELFLFKNELIKFCEYNNKNFPNSILTNVEMAGELMRTPCLQDIVKNVTGLSLSKTILTDECIAIGCSLYGSLVKHNFPLNDFKGIYHSNNYTINIKINDEEKQRFIGKSEYLPFYKFYYFDEKYFENNNSKIIISFFYEKNEIEEYSLSENDLLLTFEFDCNEIIKINGGLKNIKITFSVNDIGNIYVNSLESKIFEQEFMKFENNDNIYKIINNRMYSEKNENEKMIQEYLLKEKALFDKDRNYKNYLKQKNNLLNKLFNIKNKINESGLGDIIFEDRKINAILEDIENNLNDLNNEYINLDELFNYLDKIANSLISDDLKQKTNDFKNKISDYQTKLSEEYLKLLSGEKSCLNENQINNASNMLEHFVKKLNLILSVDDLKNLEDEFQNEIKKYF